jgi:ElaB/YqjD/DUF883 family membrane-anchored ribosome-binding protein
MTGSSRYSRAISSEIGEIERRLQTLQRAVENLATRASPSARDAAEGLRAVLTSSLSNWADRFRGDANSLGDRSAAYGRDAARCGTAALNQASKEAQQRPLFAVAVALGGGILIGLASRRPG